MTFHKISNIIYTETAMHTQLIQIFHVCACVSVFVMSLNNVDIFFLSISMHQFFCRRTSIRLPT